MCRAATCLLPADSGRPAPKGDHRPIRYTTAAADSCIWMSKLDGLNARWCSAASLRIRSSGSLPYEVVPTSTPCSRYGNLLPVFPIVYLPLFPVVQWPERTAWHVGPTALSVSTACSHSTEPTAEPSSAASDTREESARMLERRILSRACRQDEASVCRSGHRS